jgi:hypothetical protein
MPEKNLTNPPNSEHRKINYPSQSGKLKPVQVKNEPHTRRKKRRTHLCRRAHPVEELSEPPREDAAAAAAAVGSGKRKEKNKSQSNQSLSINYPLYKISFSLSHSTLF